MLESSAEMGMVHSDCAVINDNNGTVKHFVNRDSSRNASANDNWYDTILSYYKRDLQIRTVTVLIRTQLLKDVMDSDPFLFDGHLMLGDTPVWIGCLLKRKTIGYIDEETAVYRVHNGSMTHTNSYKHKLAFAISRFEIGLYYKRKYGILSEFPRIEKTYYLYVRIYRFLFDPRFKDIDGSAREPRTILRVLSKSKLMRTILSGAINVKHRIA